MERAAEEVGMHIVEPSGMGQILRRKLIERFGYLYVDVYGAYLAVHAVEHGLMHHAFAIPCLFVV